MTSTADDGQPARYSEPVGEPLLHPDHVADRDHREARAIRQPVVGRRRLQLVEPWHPPSTLGHTMK